MVKQLAAISLLFISISKPSIGLVINIRKLMEEAENLMHNDAPFIGKIFGMNRDGTSANFGCSATFLSPRIAITTSECATQFKEYVRGVVLSDFNNLKKDDNQTIQNVLDYERCSKYNVLNPSTYDCDIAILILSKKSNNVKLSIATKPVSLGSHLKLLSSGYETDQMFYKSLDVEVVESDKCAAYFKNYPSNLFKSGFCVSATAKGKITTEDFAAPLVTKVDGQYELYGLMATGDVHIAFATDLTTQNAKEFLGKYYKCKGLPKTICL